ncbi:MAG TPA: hypothetical protein VFV42_04665 [Acidimicrobiales bacterium]|nr:hypothetical protein [Acidimicrobiales bacterium]
MTAHKNPVEDVVEQALDAFLYAPIGLLFDGPARFPKLVRNGRNQVGNARMLGPFAVQQVRAEVQRRTADLDGPVVDLLRGLGVVPGPPPGPTSPARTVEVPDVPAPEPAVDAEKSVPAPVEAETKAKAVRKAAKKATKKAGKKSAPARTTAKKAPAKKAGGKAGATGPASDAEANRAAAEEAAAQRTAAADAATPSAEVLPIADYDSLSASQVVSRLGGLSAGQLDAIRAYESATRGRKTILNRVQQLSQP